MKKIYNLYAYYKKIPIVEAANVDPAFNLNGFFIKYFSKLNNLKIINSESFSDHERDKLIKKLKDNKLNFDIFLSNYDLSNEIKQKIINFYFEFLNLTIQFVFLKIWMVISNIKKIF